MTNPYYYFYNLDDLTIYHFIPFVLIWLYFKIKGLATKATKKRKQSQDPRIIKTEIRPEEFPLDNLLK